MLLSILAVSQTVHLFEHVAQMVQIHILALSGTSAQGIVGQLNIEWVHFIWNAWVFLAVVMLRRAFPVTGGSSALRSLPAGIFSSTA